jgi:tetratricopeptide (TPR) repeat protein
MNPRFPSHCSRRGDESLISTLVAINRNAWSNQSRTFVALCVHRASAVSIWIAVLLITLGTIPRARAHGELLIRINALSLQMATNSTPRLYLERGELYREDRNWPAAEADYARAVELGFNPVEVDYCRGKMLADSGELHGAKTKFNSVISRDANNGNALLARARILVRLEQRKAALTDFDRAIPLLSSAEPDSYLDWAQAAATEGQPATALRILDQGIAKCGLTNALQVYAVDLELDLKKTNAALARLDTIIELADRKERWLVRRGDIQLAAGRPLEARQSFDAAIAAIRRLPGILQRNPPMRTLESQIGTALAGIPQGPATGKVETN